MAERDITPTHRLNNARTRVKVETANGAAWVSVLGDAPLVHQLKDQTFGGLPAFLLSVGPVEVYKGEHAATWSIQVGTRLGIPAPSRTTRRLRNA
ncbi:MAG TPA: hypothetical protein VFQ63_04170 [Patescibacteria group bacterium]|nr:hypothetical protein [Patescibacteria group bacterium]